MKKIVLLIVLFIGVANVSYGQVQSGDNRYALSVGVSYAYNKTYQSFSRFNIGAYCPINSHFELAADIRLATANVYSAGVQLRPLFPLQIGELYAETRALYQAIARNQMNEISLGLGVGYRMQYVNIMFGAGMRALAQMHYDYVTSEVPIAEWFNVLYRLEVFVRPRTSPWNISVAISNVDAYQMERSEQMSFSLNMQYDVAEHWRLHLSSQCKPTGMFHLNANFYGIDVRTGIEYKF